jgi:tyrosyl-tRNA synthetase
MGGSDQWGNITTGTELIRRKLSGKAYAITCPLITKADGTKFGKSEGGNVWLDKEKTSPYSFYQYWLNTSDEDAERYIKIFTFLSEKEIQDIVATHNEAPHQRQLQRTLADEVTRMVHSEEDRARAVQAAQILFGNATSDALKNLDEQTLLDVFVGVPQASLQVSDLEKGIDVIPLLAGDTGFLPSNGDDAFVATSADLICDKYLLLQRGKKNYFLVIFS